MLFIKNKVLTEDLIDFPIVVSPIKMVSLGLLKQVVCHRRQNFVISKDSTTNLILFNASETMECFGCGINLLLPKEDVS